MARAGRGRTQRPLWCCWLMAVQDLRGMGFAWNLITSEGCFVSFLSAVCVKRCRLVTAGPGNVTVWSVLISQQYYVFQFMNLIYLSIYWCILQFPSLIHLVFSIQIFPSLFTFILNLLLWLKYYCKWDCFINFIFRLFIVSVYKHNWFWHIGLIFFDFAEFVYFFLIQKL